MELNDPPTRKVVSSADWIVWPFRFAKIPTAYQMNELLCVLLSPRGKRVKRNINSGTQSPGVNSPSHNPRHVEFEDPVVLELRSRLEREIDKENRQMGFDFT